MKRVSLRRDRETERERSRETRGRETILRTRTQPLINENYMSPQSARLEILGEEAQGGNEIEIEGRGALCFKRRLSDWWAGPAE